MTNTPCHMNEADDRQGNLDERVTDAIVWELMLQAGPVGKYLHLVRKQSLESDNP